MMTPSTTPFDLSLSQIASYLLSQRSNLAGEVMTPRGVRPCVDIRDDSTTFTTVGWLVF
jgi:hypothetical protein